MAKGHRTHFSKRLGNLVGAEKQISGFDDSVYKTQGLCLGSAKYSS